MVVRDTFEEEEKDEMIETLYMAKKSAAHKLLIAVWPDTTWSVISKDIHYLRISIQGAKSPKIAGFLRDQGVINPDKPDTNFLAPYTVHTQGLAVAQTRQIDEYQRVGYFRAIETFSTSPPPHPRGIDPNASFYRDGWLGEHCATRVVKLV